MFWEWFDAMRGPRPAQRTECANNLTMLANERQTWESHFQAAASHFRDASFFAEKGESCLATSHAKVAKDHLETADEKMMCEVIK